MNAAFSGVSTFFIDMFRPMTKPICITKSYVLYEHLSLQESVFSSQFEIANQFYVYMSICCIVLIADNKHTLHLVIIDQIKFVIILFVFLYT